MSNFTKDNDSGMNWWSWYSQTAND